MADYIFLLETRFSAEQQAVAAAMQRLCQQAGLNLYLTGGPMRDLLAGAPIRTLDFSIEGNPLRLQKPLAAEGVQVLAVDDDEQSLRLRYHAVRFRVTAAHSEAYEQFGRPPVLKAATIVDDLRRRGFTLDAIGLSLNAASRGLLLDPTNGLADIEARQIRMIHNYVFYEDPVRLLRAVRLETRLGFAIEERTAARMAAAREGGYLDHAQKGALGRELEALAYEPDPAAVLKALEKSELLEKAFGKGFRTSKMNLAALTRLPTAMQQMEEAGLSADSGPVTLHCMLEEQPAKEQARLFHLGLSKPLVAGSQRLPAEAKAVQKQMFAKSAAFLAGLHDLLHHVRTEAVLFLFLAGNAKAQKKLKDFTVRIPEIRQQLPLRELQQLGVHPDAPRFHDVIEKIYRRLLEGKLRGAEQITAALKQEAERAGAIQKPAPHKPAAGKGRGKARAAA
ncbi:MAG: hypothetical protein ACRD2H_16375, partial [Terriglobales bacterium]